MKKYKVLQYFTVPGHKAFYVDQERKLNEETAESLVRRGLLEEVKTKTKSKSEKRREAIQKEENKES